MWRCKSCGREYDDWPDKCYKCDIQRSENALDQEHPSEFNNRKGNDEELKFTKLRNYSNIIVSVGYILAGIEILYALLLLSNLYYIGGIEVLFIIIATTISVTITVITFTILGHIILVFLDIEENTRQTSEKLNKLSTLIVKKE